MPKLNNTTHHLKMCTQTKKDNYKYIIWTSMATQVDCGIHTTIIAMTLVIHMLGVIFRVNSWTIYTLTVNPNQILDMPSISIYISGSGTSGACSLNVYGTLSSIILDAHAIINIVISLGVVGLRLGQGKTSEVYEVEPESADFRGKSCSVSEQRNVAPCQVS